MKEVKLKTPKERDNLDLLELVCQLHSRAGNIPAKEMHDFYAEARKELESRLNDLLGALQYYEQGINHFYECINFGNSFLDAEAITFMNESGIKIKKAIKKSTP